MPYCWHFSWRGAIIVIFMMFNIAQVLFFVTRGQGWLKKGTENSYQKLVSTPSLRYLTFFYLVKSCNVIFKQNITPTKINMCFSYCEHIHDNCHNSADTYHNWFVIQNIRKKLLFELLLRVLRKTPCIFPYFPGMPSIRKPIKALFAQLLTMMTEFLGTC